MQNIRFEGRDALPCDAIFFVTNPEQAGHLNQTAGGKIDGGECVTVGGCESTVYGIFVAGNAKEGFNLIVIAAAEGAKAAIVINERLIEMDAPQIPLR